ncbi:four helix bundle protein [Candidatus Uhrbacteria bacterium]|nr:four helix bundle protein [Candidatus Uhrbacteria bacterium]
MNQELSRSKIQSFTDLKAWQEGHALVLEIYKITTTFPKDEQFGLTNQLRRAAVSITSNIAEGFSRNSYKEKAQFYSMALGSLTEIQNQLLIARDIGYVERSTFKKIADLTIVVSKIINGLIRGTKSIIRNS